MSRPSLGRLRKIRTTVQAFLEERTLPLLEEADLSPARSFLLFCARVYHGFIRNRCPVRAAALAYTNLLALVPLLAVVVSVSASLLKSEGEQSIQDWIREAITRVAPMLGLREAAADTPSFSPTDIKDNDLDRLVRRLQSGSGALNRYLWDSRFSAAGKDVLTNQTRSVEERKAALSAELNKAVEGGPIYDASRFARILLSKRTRSLLDQDPQGPELARLNHSLLADAYPVGEDALDTVTSQITGYVSNFQSGKLGVTAVLALIFVAISLLATVETTFNDIWGITRGRGWFARVVQYWAALTLGPMFLVSAITLTTWAKVSRHMEALPLIKIFMPFLAPLVILSLGCALLYLVMPNTKVSWQAALLGGLAAGALLQLNSYGNVMYVSRVLTYKQIYGSMAALPLFLLGLYFSWLLVLLGAQVTYAFQNRHVYAQEEKAQVVNQRGREFVAVRLMTHIAQHFRAGRRPPTALEMAEGLRIPLRLVGQIMTALGHAGLVHDLAGTEIAFAPGRPLSQISVRDILQALRAGQGQELATGDDPARPVVSKEFQVIENAWQQTASALTLDELARRVEAAQEPAGSESPSEKAR
jgi:membrane protein